jgi:hypothetical protein
LINSYFPVDTRQLYTPQENVELLETLSVIRNIINNTDCSGVIWTGDINADFARNTQHTNLVREILEELGLTVTWDVFPTDFSCVHEMEGQTSVSLVDHFFISESIIHLMIEAGSIHHPDNSSDHCPVYCIFESLNSTPLVSKSTTMPSKPSWKRASSEEKDHYRHLVDLRLSSIMVPTHVSECRDVHCHNEEHKEAIDWYATEVLMAVQDAAEEALPSPGTGHQNNKVKVTPGFNDKVKPFKDSAYFWHNVWKSAGRPLNTELHRVMKHSRNIYHKEVKKCNKIKENMKS